MEEVTVSDIQGYILKRIVYSIFSLRSLALGEVSCHVVRTLKPSCGEAYMERRLRTKAKSQH
jgi:hypothetical protein